MLISADKSVALQSYTVIMIKLDSHGEFRPKAK